MILLIILFPSSSSLFSIITANHLFWSGLITCSLSLCQQTHDSLRQEQNETCPGVRTFVCLSKTSGRVPYIFNFFFCYYCHLTRVYFRPNSPFLFTIHPTFRLTNPFPNARTHIRFESLFGRLWSPFELCVRSTWAGWWWWWWWWWSWWWWDQNLLFCLSLYHFHLVKSIARADQDSFKSNTQHQE